jgi:hypothetical protein
LELVLLPADIQEMALFIILSNADNLAIRFMIPGYAGRQSVFVRSHCEHFRITGLWKERKKTREQTAPSSGLTAMTKDEMLDEQSERYGILAAPKEGGPSRRRSCSRKSKKLIGAAASIPICVIGVDFYSVKQF